TLALLVWPGTLAALRAGLSDLLGAAVALSGCALLLRARTTRAHWGAAALLAAAVLSRWANLYLVIGVAVALLWDRRSIEAPRASRPWFAREHLARALPYAVAPVLLVGPVWLRNLWWTGTLMG